MTASIFTYIGSLSMHAGRIYIPAVVITPSDEPSFYPGRLSLRHSAPQPTRSFG